MSAGLPSAAMRATVVAQAGREEGERRGGTGPGQVAGQRPERQDVRGAVGRAGGDRAEEREPVVAGGVLIAGFGALGAVVTRLTRLGLPLSLAEVYANHIDWHQVARLVQRGCPPRLALRIVR
jgi:hypothetical protein